MNKATVPQIKKRPQLRGFSESVEDYYECARSNKVLRIGLQIDTPPCNWKCPYCYTDEITRSTLINPAPIKSILEWIKEAKSLGATAITINGTFEPTFSRDILTVVKTSSKLGLSITLVTNGGGLSDGLIDELKKNKVSVLLKLNFPISEPGSSEFKKFSKLQAYMSGLPENSNIYETIITNIHRMITAGFNKKVEENGKLVTSLGVESVITSRNLDYVRRLSRQLRDMNIYSHLEVVKVQGGCTKSPELGVSSVQLEKLFKQILNDDIKDGFEPFIPHPPYVGGTCYQNLIRLNIAANGDVRACPGVDIILGNLNKTPMKEILETSNVLKITRNLEKNIQGDCARCDNMKNHDCYGGCRGMAYQEMRARGLSDDKALVASDPSCWLVKNVLDDERGKNQQ